MANPKATRSRQAGSKRAVGELFRVIVEGEIVVDPHNFVAIELLETPEQQHAFFLTSLFEGTINFVGNGVFVDPVILSANYLKSQPGISSLIANYVVSGIQRYFLLIVNSTGTGRTIKYKVVRLIGV